MWERPSRRTLGSKCTVVRRDMVVDSSFKFRFFSLKIHLKTRKKHIF